MPAPTGIKPRDSCNACAASKVKCPKDKPTCQRCRERKTPCIYQTTRRTGRRVRSATDSAVPTELFPNLDPSTSNFLDPFSTTSATSFNTAGSLMEGANSELIAPEGLEYHADMDVSDNFLDSPFMYSCSSTSTSVPQEHDDYVLTQAEPESQDLNSGAGICSGKAFFAINAAGSQSMYGAPSNSAACSMGESLPLSFPTSDWQMPSIYRNPGSADMTGGVKDRFPETSPLSCGTLSVPSSHETGVQKRPLNSAEDNIDLQHLVQSASQFSFPNHPCLLTTISRIFLKLSEVHATTGRRASILNQTRQRTSFYEPGIPYSLRMGASTAEASGVRIQNSNSMSNEMAQKMLSELHEVQGLVNDLSSKYAQPTKSPCCDNAMSCVGSGLPSLGRIDNMQRLDIEIQKRMTEVSHLLAVKACSCESSTDGMCKRHVI